MPACWSAASLPGDKSAARFEAWSINIRSGNSLQPMHHGDLVWPQDTALRSGLCISDNFLKAQKSKGQAHLQ